MAFLVINELFSSMSTVLEMKSGYNVLCTFTYIVNRVVSGKIYTAGKILHCRRWQHGHISPLFVPSAWMFFRFFAMMSIILVWIFRLSCVSCENVNFYGQRSEAEWAMLHQRGQISLSYWPLAKISQAFTI